MIKLKTTQIKPTREKIAAEQGGRCAICKRPFGPKPADPVLDHCHRTGAVRGVPCRACNSLLGPIENNAPRFGVRDVLAFVAGVAPYLRQHAVNVTGLIHPLHRNEDEKRELRNKRARVARAKKKES